MAWESSSNMRIVQVRPRWVKPPRKPWDYTIFGRDNPVPDPVETIPLAIGKINGGKGGFNRWTINGKAFDESAPAARVEERQPLPPDLR